MFKNHFLKLFVVVCICLTSTVCSYGQGGGIIDVVIQRTAEGYELSLGISNGNQVKATLLTSDDEICFEKLISNGVVTNNLPSGTYQLIAEDQTGSNQSYFLRFFLVSGCPSFNSTLTKFRLALETEGLSLSDFL